MPLGISMLKTYDGKSLGQEETPLIVVLLNELHETVYVSTHKSVLLFDLGQRSCLWQWVVVNTQTRICLKC